MVENNKGERGGTSEAGETEAEDSKPSVPAAAVVLAAAGERMRGGEVERAAGEEGETEDVDKSGNDGDDVEEEEEEEEAVKFLSVSWGMRCLRQNWDCVS